MTEKSTYCKCCKCYPKGTKKFLCTALSYENFCTITRKKKIESRFMILQKIHCNCQRLSQTNAFVSCKYFKFNLLIPMFPPYRNQSIDLLCKSIDLFLYGGHRYEKSWKCVQEVCNLQNYNTYNLTVIWKLSTLCNANKNVIKYQKQIQ